MKLIDLTGKRFGRLVVISRAEDHVRPNKSKAAMWNCKCDCGNDKIVEGAMLRKGTTQSCGCLASELASKRKKRYNTYDLTGNFGIGYTSKGEEFYFDLEDYDLIKGYCWHRMNKGGYITAKICNGLDKHILLHRIVMNNPNSEVDHINGKRYDCRKENLRPAEINGLNRNNQNKIIQSNNTSGIVGVTWHKRDEIWESYISINHKRIYLGRYTDINEAIKVRKQAEEKYFGEWSFDNSRNITNTSDTKITQNI